MAVSRYMCINEKINVIHLNCLAFCSCGSSSYGSLFQTLTDCTDGKNLLSLQ